MRIDIETPANVVDVDERGVYGLPCVGEVMRRDRTTPGAYRGQRAGQTTLYDHGLFRPHVIFA